VYHVVLLHKAPAFRPELITLVRSSIATFRKVSTHGSFARLGTKSEYTRFWNGFAHVTARRRRAGLSFWETLYSSGLSLSGCHVNVFDPNDQDDHYDRWTQKAWLSSGGSEIHVPSQPQALSDAAAQTNPCEPFPSCAIKPGQPDRTTTSAPGALPSGGYMAVIALGVLAVAAAGCLVYSATKTG